MLGSSMAGAAPHDLEADAEIRGDTLGKEAPKKRLVAENFITEIIDRDLEEGRYPGVVTRFPPNPTATCTSGTPRASA